MKRAITIMEGEKKPGFHDPNVKDYKPLTSAQQLFGEAYKVFKDEKELQKHVEVGENIWDKYSATEFGVNKTTDLTLEQKTSFEFYVCGWLQYYDQVTRNNAIDHTIYFKWKEHEVIVYISPKPGSSNDPIKSPPANRTSDPQSPKIPPPPNP